MKLKRTIKRELAEALFDLDISKQDNQRMAKQLGETKSTLAKVTEQRDEYRAKYELLYHTPDFKADTEAAFARGGEKMRQSVISWLIGMPKLNYKVEDK